MLSSDFGSVQQFCCKWISSRKTRQHLLKWLAYNYYSQRDAGRSLLLRKREVQRGLALDAADMCWEEAAPLQAAISPPPSPLLGSGLRPGTVRSWSRLPLAAVFCDVTIMMRIDDRTRWFHCLRRQWRPRKNLAEYACPSPGLIWDPLIPPVTAPRPR